MVVMKFGGTSVGDAGAIRRVASIVASERRPRLVVVSALAGVTDRLIEVAHLAGSGDRGTGVRAIEDLHARHVEAAAVVEDPPRRAALTDEVDATFEELTRLVEALATLREVSPRTLDTVVAYGELLSSRIVAAALEQSHIPTVWVDARRVLVTDAAHGRAAPLMDDTARMLDREVRPRLSAHQVPLVGGFIGATAEGVTTTLGRGGSDYSAAVFGSCLGADEIQIWTDVDGMLTADPRIVPSARLVPCVSYDEAAELAYFGAKVLHPSTIQPAVERGIPVRILNSRNPASAGTLITAARPGEGASIVGIACKRGITVIDITSTRMLLAYGFLLRVFEIFARFQTAVDLVTTSEVSVSVTIDDPRHLQPIVAALSEFADVLCEGDLALVSVVGERLRSDPGLFTKVAGTLDGLGLRMVSQADTRRNVTFVLRQEDLQSAMIRLHDRFFGHGPASAPHGEPLAQRESVG